MTWDDVWRAEWKRVLGYARRMAWRPGDDPENAAQAAFVRVWRQKLSPDVSPALMRWTLFRAVREVLRGPKRENSPAGGPSVRTDWTNREYLTGSGRWIREGAPDDSDIEEWFPDDFPPECRRVLVKAFAGKMSLSEIGESEGRTKNWALAAYKKGLMRVARRTEGATRYTG